MSVRIDCDSCLVRGLSCHDCVVTVLLGPPPELSFDEEEQRALGRARRLRAGAAAADGDAGHGPRGRERLSAVVPPDRRVRAWGWCDAW